MSSPLAMGVAPALQAPGSRAVRLAVLSDTHLSPAGTPEGVWNNATRRSCAGETLRAALAEIVALRRLLVLGDISDDGSPEMIACALSLGGPRQPRRGAARGCDRRRRRADRRVYRPVPRVAATWARPGPRGRRVAERRWRADLHSGSPAGRGRPGGRPSPVGRTLLAASQQARLRVAGLRYPGDLLNLQHAPPGQPARSGSRRAGLPSRQCDLVR